MRLYTDEQGIWNVNFKENETVASFVQRFKDENSLHFKSGWTLKCIADGHQCSPDEIMLDRDYYLTAWLSRA